MVKFLFDEVNKKIVLVFSDGTEVYLQHPSSFQSYRFYHKPEVRDVFLLELFKAFETFQILYRIDFNNKTIKTIFTVQEGKILDYNTNFVLYKSNYELKKTFCVLRDFYTNEEHLIKLNFEVKKGKIGNKYILFYGLDDFDRYQFALYDIEQKQIINQNLNIVVSDDFLNGKTSFYYVEKYIPDQKLYLCTIYNKDKPIATVNRNPNTLFQSELHSYNWIITEKTQYIASNEENLIHFYKLTPNGLQFLNTLELDRNYFYETHLLSCGTKFMICGKTKSKEKIFIYDVNNNQIEYENTYPLEIKQQAYESQFIFSPFLYDVFIETLNLYVHGFKNYFFSISEKKNHIFLTLNQKTETEGIKIFRHLIDNFYIAYKKDINKHFLLRIYNQNEYEILTEEFFKPNFCILDDLIIILTTQPTKASNDLFIQKQNVLTKIAEIDKNISGHYVPFSAFTAKKLSDNLIFLKFQKPYGLIHDLVRNKIYLIPLSNLIIEPYLAGICDYFVVIKNKTEISVFNKEGKEVIVPYSIFLTLCENIENSSYSYCAYKNFALLFEIGKQTSAIKNIFQAFKKNQQDNIKI